MKLSRMISRKLLFSIFFFLQQKAVSIFETGGQKLIFNAKEERVRERRWRDKVRKRQIDRKTGSERERVRVTERQTERQIQREKEREKERESERDRQ